MKADLVVLALAAAAVWYLFLRKEGVAAVPTREVNFTEYDDSGLPGGVPWAAGGAEVKYFDPRRAGLPGLGG